MPPPAWRETCSLAGLLDLGVPISAIEEPLNSLGLAGRYRIDVVEARSGGLRGQRVSVTGLESQPPIVTGLIFDSKLLRRLFQLR